MFSSTKTSAPDDGRKFNRGKLLNVGFDIARAHPGEFDVFVYHDVDLLPGDDLGTCYATYPSTPLHIARVWDRWVTPSEGSKGVDGGGG